MSQETPLKPRPLLLACIAYLILVHSVVAGSTLYSTDKNNTHLLDVPSISAQLLEIQAHNPNWFTQGLYSDEGGFFISSGLYGKSSLIYQSKKKNLRHTLPRKYFAEGLTVIDDKLYLLTWKENTVLVFDKKTLQQKGKLTYKGEGWGLTHTDKEFVMSNGSNKLLFRNKDTFAINRTMIVNGINYINELEYVNGIIWANRWYDDHLYAIDAKNGCLLAKVNINHLRKQAGKPDNKNITNGIAYDREKKGLWVTGKYWSKRFLIQLPKVQSKTC